MTLDPAGTAPLGPPSRFDYGHPPAGYSRPLALAAWLVILACVAIVAVTNWRAARTARRVQATEDFQLQITSRITLGEVHLFSSLPGFSAGLRDKSVEQVSTLAAGPIQKLRFATVVGEIQGGKAALAELDAAAAAGLKSDEARADLATLRTIYTSGPAAVPAAARDGLIARQGWFGRLALSFGLPDLDPARAQIIRSAKRAFAATILVEGAAILAALAGLVLLIVAIVRLAQGRLHLYYGRAPTPSTAFIEAFAVYLIGHVGIGFLARYLMPGQIVLGTTLSLMWIPLAMLWPLIRGLTWSQLVGGLGWYRGQGIAREIGAGLLGYFTGLPIVLIAILITMVLTTRTHTSASHPIEFMDVHSVGGIVELYLLAVVLAPLVEETMFRGALFTHLRQRHGWFLSGLVSSFIFAALHPQGWTAIPALGTIGFVLASIREWRGTFIASTAAHALNNGVLVTILVIAMR